MTQNQTNPTNHSGSNEELKLLKKIVTLSPGVIYVYDLVDRKNVFVNENISRILGYTTREVRDMGEQVIPTLMHPDDLKFYLEQTVHRYREMNDADALVLRYRMRNKDDTWHWLEANERIFLRNPDGSARQIVGVIHDITSIREAEDALRESEQSLKQLIAHLNAGVVIHAPDTHIIFASEKASELLGLSIDQMMGKVAIDPAWCFLRDDESPLSVEEYPVTRVLRTLQPIKNQIHGVIRPASHDRVWVMVNAFPEFHPDGTVKHAVVTFIDVTERKEAELATLSQQRRFGETQQKSQRLESLGILAGGIAHEFNNLLGAMFGNVENAMAHIRDHQLSKALDALDASFDVFDRTKALTRQLLTFASGGAPVRKKTDIKGLIEQSVQFTLSGAAGSNVTHVFEIDDDLWPCECDENQIGQAIDNIVLNGQQAMPEGGILVITASNTNISNAIERGGIQNGPFVQINIKDEGNGINEENLQKIFDPFFTTKTIGHGLGLATAYSIINRHGGWIDVKSKEGKGTTLTLFIPAATFDDATKNSAAGADKSHCEAVLIMDDEQMLLDIESTMLESMGYSVVCAHNGQEALELFKTAHESGTPFTFSILDLTVPKGMGGAEAVKAMRQIDAGAIVIVASGYANDPIVTNPTEHGFTDKIIKPFRKRELLELLAQYIP